MNNNLYSVLQTSFGPHLDKAFLSQPGQGEISYREIDSISAKLANTLVDLGIKVGDRVVVQVPKSAEAVALYLACLRMGAVYMPLNTSYTASEVQYFIDDALPGLFIHDTETEARAIQNMTLTELNQLGTYKSATHEIVKSSPDDLAAMLYTSGTTGRSKGAMLTHSNLVSNAQALHDIWGFVDGDVLLHVLPIFHVHGLFVALHTAMLNASTVIFHDRFTPEAAIASLPGASVMMGVPTHYIRLLENEAFDAELCKSVRLFTSGSAPMTADIHEQFFERTQQRILERYGMTEAGMITSNPYGGDRVPGTVGYALPGVQLRVCNAEGQQCAPGETGIVEMKGPNLFAGYWQLPDKTKSEHRADGFFITGDIGSLDKTGRLTLEGRSGDMIISGGYNIYPKEIEVVLDAVLGVTESAVIGVPSPDLGEIPLAVIVGQSDDRTTTAISDALEAQLARFKRPRRIEFVDELPRNAMGKIQKAELRKRFG